MQVEGLAAPDEADVDLRAAWVPQTEYSRKNIPGTHLPTPGDGQLSWLIAKCVSCSDDWV